jgi:RIO kinase 1
MSSDRLNSGFYDDRYDDYEAQFDPMHSDRSARRKRNPTPNHTPKARRGDILSELSDEIDWDNAFEPTYQPSKHEADWLLSSLRGFYDQALITDVLTQVKGGKEASVYCCAADPSTGVEYLAAKVYRPRKFRALTNDKMYREGRGILSAEGHIVHENKDRVMRALGKKTAFGQQVAHTSWLMHEFGALQTLFDAGAAVPKPYQAGDNAILMDFVGIDTLAAPMLNTVRLEDGEADNLFVEVVRNIELMLQHSMIHGDLSAYNILYLNGSITIIDLPQVVEARSNRNAPAILARDVQRICDYFGGQGLPRDAEGIYRDLWRRYLDVPERILQADTSRLAQLYPEIFGEMA